MHGRFRSYHSRSSDAESLHDMARRRNATIGNAWHAKLSGDARDIVNGGGLRAAHSTHFLSRADGSTAHTHAQTVHARLNEVVGLPGSDHVATDELNVRVGGLDVLDHVDLVHGVALG